MFKTFLAAAAILFVTLSSFARQKKSHVPNVKVRIPTQWVENLRHYNFQPNNEVLISEFETFIKPDSLPGQKNHDGNGILNPMFIDLDGESGDELICLIGRNEEYPALTVFKKITGVWYLLYYEPFYMFYSKPEVYIANNYSKNKTFYTRQLYDRGTGIYRDGYCFYKLINNRVYPCLLLINKAHIYGWGLFLNQDIKMQFQFNSADADEISVDYDYNFFPGAVFASDVPWDSHDSLSFVQDKQQIMYSWDNLHHKYYPVPYRDSASLNPDKIACFGDFGNDKLFVRAFNYEIKQTLKTCTPLKRKLLKKYLSIVRSKGKTTTGDMEEKVQIGNLKFYGPKK